VLNWNDMPNASQPAATPTTSNGGR
jgi:hypothetical protein